MNKDDSNKQDPKPTIKDKNNSRQSTKDRRRRSTPALEDYNKCPKSLPPRQRPKNNSLSPPKNNDDK